MKKYTFWFILATTSVIGIVLFFTKKSALPSLLKYQKNLMRSRLDELKDRHDDTYFEYEERRAKSKKEIEVLETKIREKSDAIKKMEVDELAARFTDIGF